MADYYLGRGGVYLPLKIKRIYEPCDPSDGVRILIDRVWPRGVSKERARLDEWMKDIAPSPTLRKWFQHDPEKFAEFKKAYRGELEADSEKIGAVSRLLDMLDTNIVTLLYGAKDEIHNHAIVLKQYLEERIGEE